MAETEYAFQMAAPNVRFGPGVSREVGVEVRDCGLQKVALFTDERLVQMAPVQTVQQSLKDEGCDFETFDRVRIEPNDQSFQEAIEFRLLEDEAVFKV